MHVVFRKSPPEHGIEIRRRDGVAIALRSPTRKFPLPHDLIHLVAERALGLERGFWGTVAAGGMFPSMRIVGGRQPPHAARRSKTLLKENRAHLAEAEVVVGLIQRELLDGERVGHDAIRHRLAERGKHFAPGAVDACWSTLLALCRQWDALAPGEEIVLDWTRPRGTRTRR